jgi:aspartyl/glutamyl-tRNA(Asn/Gln) amidotransferase C subunit
MANISREEVAHLARLSRLAVTDEEIDMFAGQLDGILQAVARVGEVDADDVPATSHNPIQGRVRSCRIIGNQNGLGCLRELGIVPKRRKS